MVVESIPVFALPIVHERIVVAILSVSIMNYNGMKIVRTLFGLQEGSVNLMIY